MEVNAAYLANNDENWAMEHTERFEMNKASFSFFINIFIFEIDFRDLCAITF